jgi:N-acetyltransferase
MAMFETPVTLTGRWVRLVPLSTEHAPALREAFRDPEVGRYLLHRPGETLEEMESLIARYLDLQRSGEVLPFTTVLRASDRPIGMTNYLHIDRENHCVEVGGTWLDSAYWRTPVNTETKYLLFRHAFEVEHVHRVSLQTNLKNERSQRAIARVGATREAVFRDDKLLADGTFRTSVVFGLLVSEWPRVKTDLEAQLARPWNPPDGWGRPPAREGS